jgi:N-acetylglucosamine kinase-like BadF-type ATPase
MSDRLALAVDGGNSKTDLALIREDGALLSVVRGPGSSQHKLGVEGSVEVLGTLLGRAATEAGVEVNHQPVAEVSRVMIAGADLPEEEETLQNALADQGWAPRTEVANDTFAVLRTGTDRGWGVALVCGAGMNCVGVGPDGRHVRHPALGAITGDWGGGYDVGLAGLSAAARSADGRGPQTALETIVPGHFGLSTPMEVAEAIHLDGLDRQRIGELAPVVLTAAKDDDAAAGIAERLMSEVTAFLRVTLEQLDVTGEPVDVVLGGGLLQGDGAWLVESIAERLTPIAPEASVSLVDAPPVVGAALLGLDDLGAPADARDRARHELTTAVAGEYRAPQAGEPAAGDGARG